MPPLQDHYRIIDNKKVCPRFHVMRIGTKDLARRVKPGQFVHIRVSPDLRPFFRRPFSVYRARRDVSILYEVVGPGTLLLSRKTKGDLVDVLGPVGNGFDLPPEETKEVVMIAGGIGVAPFLVLSDVLKKRKLSMTLLYGARTKGHVYDFKEFRKNGCRVLVVTEDGSKGAKGRVDRLFSEIRRDPAGTFLYTCGPRPMMAAVQDFAAKHRLRGQASCEEVMACALGACLGCSIRTTEGYRTVCYDGPVFDLDKLIFARRGH